MKSLISFADFQQNQRATPVKPAICRSALREAALLVDTDFKVKLTLDVPVTLLKSYIDKVKSETGKDPLQTYTEAELAEEMLRYVVKKNLVLDQIPTSLAVGQGAAEPTGLSKEAPTEQQNDAPVNAAQPEDDVYDGAEEIELSEDEPAEGGDHKGIDFETKEATAGEGQNIQLDPTQKVSQK